MGYMPVVMFDLKAKYKTLPTADYPTGPGFIMKGDGGQGDRARQAGHALERRAGGDRRRPLTVRTRRWLRESTTGVRCDSRLRRLLGAAGARRASPGPSGLRLSSPSPATAGLFSAKGIVNVLEVSAELGILAAAVALLMIAGEFDLSVGSMIGFAGIVIGHPARLSGAAAVASRIAARLRRARSRIGYLNGLVVVKTGLPSFIVTLGGLFILRGLTLGLTRRSPAAPRSPGIHDWRATTGWRLVLGHVVHGPLPVDGRASA